MKNISLYLLLLLPPLATIGQESTNYFNKSNVNIELGTILIYNTVAINYESVDFLKNSNKHHLKLAGGIGYWKASLQTANSGFLFNSNLIYLYGESKHHFELDLGASYHLDKGLDETKFTYLATTPNLFIGYRYQKPEGRFNFKIGTGIFEIMQVGFGYSF